MTLWIRLWESVKQNLVIRRIEEGFERRMLKMMDIGYDDWKEAMLRKAVDDGFLKYKKYLKVKN